MDSLGRLIEGTAYQVQVKNTGTGGAVFFWVRWIANTPDQARTFGYQISPGQTQTHGQTCPPVAGYPIVEVEVDLPEGGSADLAVTGLVANPPVRTLTVDEIDTIEIDPPAPQQAAAAVQPR